jgi:serine/threonine-protein kinase
MGALATALSGLGDPAGALKVQEQAVEKLRAANDFFDGPGYESGLAQLQAQAGLKDRAIATVKHLLSTNGATITPALLRLDPNWDSLRDDPRFQALTVDRTPAPAAGGKSR